MLFDFAIRSPGNKFHKSWRAPENLFCSIGEVGHPHTRKFPEERIFSGIGF